MKTWVQQVRASHSFLRSPKTVLTIFGLNDVEVISKKITTSLMSGSRSIKKSFRKGNVLMLQHMNDMCLDETLLAAMNFLW